MAPRPPEVTAIRREPTTVLMGIGASAAPPRGRTPRDWVRPLKVATPTTAPAAMAQSLPLCVPPSGGSGW